MSDACSTPIRAVDTTNQLDDVLALPDHLRDALWRVESTRARAGRVERPAGLRDGRLGDRRRTRARPRSGPADAAATGRARLRAARWAPADRAVLCSSYSGNTEETLACFEAAEALGATALVATTGGALRSAAQRDGVPIIGLPGGLQPRAAVGYMFVVAAEAAAWSAPRRASAPRSTPPRRISRPARDAAIARSAEIAAAIGGSTPTDLRLRASPRRSPIAGRPSSTRTPSCTPSPNELPELDHNEIVGWGARADGSAILQRVFL